jgi:hypothetical protein
VYGPDFEGGRAAFAADTLAPAVASLEAFAAKHAAATGPFLVSGASEHACANLTLSVRHARTAPLL